MELTLVKFAVYGGVIVWLNVTGGASWHGIKVEPCNPSICYRTPFPPVGSYWVYRNGRYLVAYNGRILPQGTRHGHF